MVRELERMRPPDGWQRALDVGCGDGLFFDVLGRYADEVEGVEPDTTLVSPQRAEDGRIHLRPFDASFRPGRKYDLMLFLDVLEHIRDASGAVAHAASLLQPGGTIIVTVPAYRHLWTTHDDLNQHVRRYSRRELVRLLSRSLDIVHTRYLFGWVYKAKLFQRALEWVRRPEPSPPGIPPEPINRALYALSRIDEAVFRHLPLPIGSSVLAVARKRA